MDRNPKELSSSSRQIEETRIVNRDEENKKKKKIKERETEKKENGTENGTILQGDTSTARFFGSIESPRNSLSMKRTNCRNENY